MVLVRAPSNCMQDLRPLVWWALLTIAVWSVGRALRHRFGRGEEAEPGQRDRTIAAAIDGLDLVLAPILAVWLIGRLLAASPEAGTAAARFLEAAGAGPLPALSWLAEGAGRVAGELEAALPDAGIACDRTLPRYWRRPS